MKTERRTLWLEHLHGACVTLAQAPVLFWSRLPEYSPDILFVNLDAPINFGHNYYLYQDDGGRFSPIIWDLNENFGVFSRINSQTGPGSQSNLEELDLFFNSTSSTYRIVSKVLSNPTYKKMYVAHLKTMFQDIVASDWYVSRAYELQALIADEVRADSNKFYSYSAFTRNVESAVTSGESSPGLKALMDSRTSYLYTQPEFTVLSPEFTGVPTTVISESQVGITIEVTNANVVQLAYRDCGHTLFEKIDMVDDGMHNDGQAGDGLYGVMIEQPLPSMQYYIYAENDDAAAFYPPRAEYEVFTLSSASDVVINEFMADNSSYCTDANDEFADWIELYNTSDVDIDLSGYCLSDDAEDLTKWMFPDVTIAAGDFLIVWADEDSEQSGVHADLRLSADGEALYLVRPDLQIVDQVRFGPQNANTSCGRLPNGTGPFIKMSSPTFSQANEDSLTETQNTITVPRRR